MISSQIRFIPDNAFVLLDLLWVFKGVGALTRRNLLIGSQWAESGHGDQGYFPRRPVVVCGKPMGSIARNAEDISEAVMKKSSMRPSGEAGESSLPDEFIYWAREHSTVEHRGYLARLRA